MDHTLKSRPVVATVAAIAAVLVMLATTVAPPKPAVAAAAPRVSTQVVQLVASSEAEASAVVNIDPGKILQNALGRVAAGAGYGVLLGFIAAAAVSNVIYQIPAVGPALAPLIPVVALTFAIVAAPIGAVVGALSLLSPLPIRIPTAGRKAAVTSPRDSARSGSRANRQVAKSSAPTARKASVPKQSSEPARAHSARDRATTSNRVARH
ncbi:hypothetical protein FHT44_001526 [Mycolicibacterium sp. BK634]|uniref:hypothetical protein n=1 Tax=Mycolicibacterium sp. BK634 TaxID=2587099 RepID=UPI00160CECE9|nr:hypothetical protein [Mycolicibacterium sp. BK634]MBB3749065.1 hypothetical protein [Mycolicibacterium sp. BK634]